jgi:cytoskeleton protein RodZ
MSDEAVAVSADAQDHSEQLSLGARLRQAREARDLSVEKIADELRIEEHVLVALEDDRLSDIEAAPVFIKGYIKQYGRLLQLDYEELRQAFQNQTNAEDVRLRPNTSIQLRDERQITKWIIAAVAIVFVGGALALWWFSVDEVRIFNPFSSSGSDDQAAVVSDTRAVSLPLAASSDAADARSGAVQPERSEDARLPESLQVPVQVQVPEAQPETAPAQEPIIDTAAAEVGPAGGDENAGAIVAAPTDFAALDPLPAVPEPGSVPMSFSFSEESWFELTDARGRRLYYDLAPAGAQLSFVPLPPARVLIGNADAVRITVASADFTIPARSRRVNNVASFVIDPAQD